MKILFLTSSAPLSDCDSTSPFIITMAEDLQKLGHSVTVLMPCAPNANREEVIGGVRVLRYRYMWPNRFQKLSGEGGALVKLKKRPWLAALLFPLAIAQIWSSYRLLHTGEFDLLHTHWLLPQGLLGGVVARSCGVPHVAMIHGADVFGLQHPLWLRVKKWALVRTDSLIVNSSATATAIRALNANQSLEVIPVGATEPKGSVIPLASRFSAPQPKVLFVGRLFEGKGLHFLLHAMTKMPNVKLHVIGDGPDKNDLQALSEQLGLSACVNFLGTLPHEQVLEQMRSAAMLVAPSITTDDGWREAQGNAIVEAMLAGTPVIASHSGGIEDAVIHEQTGLLVPEKDSEGIAQAMQRLLGDPALAESLGEAGLAHAKAYFTRAGSAKRIDAIYRALA